uniref:EF-hand domain pair n=1 Tax=Helianthus annuus TaxID=4232 RepID=A0A251RTD0_HELAN
MAFYSSGLKCVGLDGNGVITRNEMQFFYEEQLHRMKCGINNFCNWYFFTLTFTQMASVTLVNLLRHRFELSSGSGSLSIPSIKVTHSYFTSLETTPSPFCGFVSPTQQTPQKTHTHPLNLLNYITLSEGLNT